MTRPAAVRIGRRALVLAAALCAPALFVSAQGRGGPGGPGGGGPPRGGMGGEGMSRGTFGNPTSMPNLRTSPPPGGQPGSSESTLRGGLQIGPPGRWWDEKQFAQSIGLDSAQQRRMDDVFNANKGTLIKSYKALQHEESQLEKITRARELNEAQIFDQIDRVVQARGDLEKASAHMLLQIRKEMTPEQATRLDDHRPSAQ